MHSGAETTNTDSDADGVSGLGGAAVIYLLWGESAGAEVDEAGFRAVVGLLSVNAPVKFNSETYFD